MELPEPHGALGGLHRQLAEIALRDFQGRPVDRVFVRPVAQDALHRRPVELGRPAAPPASPPDAPTHPPPPHAPPPPLATPPGPAPAVVLSGLGAIAHRP